jgi:hypothetical protein
LQAERLTRVCKSSVIDFDFSAIFDGATTVTNDVDPADGEVVKT